MRNPILKNKLERPWRRYHLSTSDHTHPQIPFVHFWPNFPQIPIVHLWPHPSQIPFVSSDHTTPDNLCSPLTTPPTLWSEYQMFFIYSLDVCSNDVIKPMYSLNHFYFLSEQQGQFPRFHYLLISACNWVLPSVKSGFYSHNIICHPLYILLSHRLCAPCQPSAWYWVQPMMFLSP